MSILGKSTREALAILLSLEMKIVFETDKHTVHLQEFSNEFDISAYPLGTKCNENMEFNEDLLVAGGIVQDGDCLDAVNYAYDL